MGKKILITGGTSGIGLQIVKQFAALGHTLIVVGRNSKRLEKMEKSLGNIHPNTILIPILGDLACQEEILKVATTVRSVVGNLDILIHNAACVSTKFVLTKDNIELQFAVNHLAPFLLTHLLLPLMEKSEQARIISVSSRAHARGIINLDETHKQKDYNISKAYNQSKLANLMFTYSLAEKLKQTNITVNAFHPGLVNTNFGNKNVNWFHNLAWFSLKLFGRRPEKVAPEAINLALNEELNQISGKYFFKGKTISSSPLSYDTNLQQKVWQHSLTYTKLKENTYGVEW